MKNKKYIKERTENDLDYKFVNYKSSDVAKLVLKITNYLDTEYTKQQNHPFLLGDCILGKFNLLGKRKIRKNPYYVKPKKYEVDIWESESGWGKRIDETKEFNTQVEAEEFIREYNKDLGKEFPAPDYYSYAKAANFEISV